MLRRVHFNSVIEETLGVKQAEFDVDSPVQLYNALNSQITGFKQLAKQHPEWVIVLADSKRENFKAITPELVNFPLDHTATDVFIAPRIEGAGIEAALTSWIVSVGASQTVAAVLASIVVNLAVSFAIGLVSQMLAPSPTTSEGSARPDENPSFLFNGAVNVVEQGYPVPLVYGKHMVGSVVVSAGISVEDIGYESTVLTTPPTAIPPAEPWQFGQ